MTEQAQTYFKSLSTKLPRDEVTLVEDYCKRKGTTVSKLLREAVLREIDIPVPHNVAGRNEVSYNEETDTFTWSVKLDDGKTVPVIENVSAEYLKDLLSQLDSAQRERDSTIKRKNGIAVPARFGGRHG